MHRSSSVSQAQGVGVYSGMSCSRWMYHGPRRRLSRRTFSPYLRPVSSVIWPSNPATGACRMLSFRVEAIEVNLSGPWGLASCGTYQLEHSGIGIGDSAIAATPNEVDVRSPRTRFFFHEYPHDPSHRCLAVLPPSLLRPERLHACSAATAPQTLQRCCCQACANPP